MNKKTAAYFDKIDEKLQQLLNNLQQYSDEELNRKPTPESWSVLQVMHHLMLAESLSGKYVQKKLSFNPKLKGTNLGTAWRMLVLRSYNYLPFKLKAPRNVGSENLPETSRIEETAEKWLAQRRELRAYLSTLPEEIFKKEVYKHPFAGRLSLDGMLRFFEGHFDRHRKQIDRILDA